MLVITSGQRMAAMNRMVYSRDNPEAGCSTGRYVRRPVIFAHSIEQCEVSVTISMRDICIQKNGTDDNEAEFDFKD